MNYEKIETSQRGPGISEDDWNDEFEGCSCIEECSAESKCSCLMGGAGNYSGDGKLLPSTNPLLVECSDNCSCALLHKTCQNRVVQNGVRKRLEVKFPSKKWAKWNFQIFSTSEKGHGVRAAEPINKGEFVCEYAGECIGEEEVERRCVQFQGQDNYTLTLKEHFGGKIRRNLLIQFFIERTIKTFVDPRLRGNIGRFLNHSCNPNCEVVVVRLGRMIPTVGIFAKKDIETCEELCYDYGNSALDGTGRTPCHCKAENCRGYLPMSATPIE